MTRRRTATQARCVKDNFHLENWLREFRTQGMSGDTEAASLPNWEDLPPFFCLGTTMTLPRTVSLLLCSPSTARRIPPELSPYWSPTCINHPLSTLCSPWPCLNPTHIVWLCPSRTMAVKGAFVALLVRVNLKINKFGKWIFLPLKFLPILSLTAKPGLERIKPIQ